jgi:glycerate dehydrogenase
MSQPPHIVFLDASTVDTGDIDFAPLRELGELTRHPSTSTDELDARAAAADILITNKTVLDARALAAAREEGLSLIVVCATGVNNIDLDAARENHITVSNIVGYSTPSVAQHTISVLLNLANNAHLYAAEANLWPESPIFTRLAHPIIELNDKLLGIAGAGNIGCRVGEIAKSLGMDIQVLARPGSLTARHPEWPRVDRDTFFESSDAISLHCPLTEDTHHMIDAATLRQMKGSALLVNTGRGDLIDEPALADALRSHRIAGAGLDVLSAEPPPADHPLLDADIPGLLITPHTAWASHESRVRLIDGVAENIRSYLAGSPTNRIV